MNTRQTDDNAESRLDKALAELPRELAPGSELWPGIAKAIANGDDADRRTSRSNNGRPLLVRLALAASLVAVSSLATAWWMGRGSTDRALIADGKPFSALVGPVILPASYDETRVPGARYMQDRAVLVQALEEQILLLPEETRKKLAADMQVIHDALTDISMELTGDPGNVLLQKLLLTMYQRELTLLDDLNQMTAAMKAQRTEKRTEI
jgi:hypothetical protein